MKYKNICGSRATMTLLAIEPRTLPHPPCLCEGHKHHCSYEAVEVWQTALVLQSDQPAEPGEIQDFEIEIGTPFMAHLDRIKWSAPEDEGGRFELLELDVFGEKILAVPGALMTDPAAVGVQR